MSDPRTKTSNLNDELVWKVCESIRDCLSHCEKCPAEIDSPYGKGKQGCRLHAEEVVALVRGSNETLAVERSAVSDARLQTMIDKPSGRDRHAALLELQRWRRAHELKAKVGETLTPETSPLSEKCPKCGKHMFNWPGNLTKCLKCQHEWYMDSSTKGK